MLALENYCVKSSISILKPLWSKQELPLPLLLLLTARGTVVIRARHNVIVVRSMDILFLIVLINFATTTNSQDTSLRSFLFILLHAPTKLITLLLLLLVPYFTSSASSKITNPRDGARNNCECFLHTWPSRCWIFSSFLDLTLRCFQSYDKLFAWVK